MIRGAHMSGAQHSHESVEHYTPEWIVELARATMHDTIHLDPASCEFANKVVKAEAIFTGDPAHVDGLTAHWGIPDHSGMSFGHSHVFVNPPGKVPGKRGGQALWWAKACREIDAGNAACIIFVSFSVELLQTAQRQQAHHPLDFTVLFPKRRVAYDREVDGARVAGTSPPHSSMIVCMSRCQFGKVDAPVEGYATRFARLAKPFGYVHDAAKCTAC